MLAVDAAIVLFLNRFANRSCAFDGALSHVQGMALLKGAFVLTIVWAVLFARGEARTPRRAHLEAVFLLAVPALLVTRVLAKILPFRHRPIHDPSLHFQVGCGLQPEALDGWSAFPSDHAVMYCMLAVGIGFVSRRLGWLAMAYVVAVVLLPRVYLGLHWPSDILAGGVLGIAFAYLARHAAERIDLGRWTAALRERHPGAFHAGMFLASYLIATHFNEARGVARALTAFAGTAGP